MPTSPWALRQRDENIMLVMPSGSSQSRTSPEITSKSESVRCTRESATQTWKEFRAKQSLLNLGRQGMSEEGPCDRGSRAKLGNSPAHLSSCSFPLSLLPHYVAFFLFWELPKLISALGPLHLQFMFGKQGNMKPISKEYRNKGEKGAGP